MIDSVLSLDINKKKWNEMKRIIPAAATEGVGRRNKNHMERKPRYCYGSTRMRARWRIKR